MSKYYTITPKVSKGKVLYTEDIPCSLLYALKEIWLMQRKIDALKAKNDKRSLKALERLEKLLA